MNEKIRFGNLSIPLKIAIVTAYIFLGIWIILFITGFLTTTGATGL